MKLPSLSHILKETTNTFKRFPLTLTVAILGTFVAISLIEIENTHTETHELTEHLAKVLMCLGLSLSLSFAWHIFTEIKQKTVLFKIIGFALIAGAIIGYYFTLNFDTFEEKQIYRYGLLLIFAHLLAALAAFQQYKNIGGFWQYNKTLFLRFLLSALYSGVLFLGLVIALVAIDQLFNMDIDEIRYAELFAFIAGIFNTWFFLSGIPKNLSELNEDETYPKGLKIFTQFVLLPLVSIYMLILYAYMAKITLSWNLPKGWVSNLIIAFSVAGIFSLLLIYPIRNQEENKWIKWFSKIYYIILLPLVALLFVSIFKRIGDYGITEDRYIVMILGFWLLLMALYFLISKKDNIILIPASLALIALLISCGPLNMFQISKWSQKKRFASLLEKNKLLENGKIVVNDENAKAVSQDDQEQVLDILDYFKRTHGIKSLVYLVDDECQSEIMKEEKSYDQEDLFTECSGINKFSHHISTERYEYEYYRCNANSLEQGMWLNNAVYVRSIAANSYYNEGDVSIKNNTLLVINDSLIHKNLEFDLKPLYNHLKEADTKEDIPDIQKELMFLSQHNAELRISNISFRSDEALLLNNLTGILVIYPEQDKE